MSTNQNQQINVFNKGMNTDTSDAYLSNEQYRYAENLRFITDTGENSGELRLIEGYKEVYNDLFGGSQARKIIATTSVRNFLIFLTNVNFGRGVHGSEILYVDTNTNEYFKPYVSTTDRWDADKYSLVTRWESEKNVKLYIADGIHPLMSINLMAEDGEYSSIDQLISERSGKLDPFSYEVRENGNIAASNISYCYILYNTGGFSTDISPNTGLIRLYDGSLGYDTESSTNKNVELKVQIQSEFLKIKVYRLEYVENGKPANVYVIYDGNVNVDESGVFYFNDTGTNIASVAYSEFLQNSKYYFIPKLIESKNDHLFVANVRDYLYDINELFKDVTARFDVVWDDDDSYTEDQYGKIHSGRNNYGESLMPGESYRYGIVYYTKDGYRTSVLNSTLVEVGDYDLFEIVPQAFADGTLETPEEMLKRTSHFLSYKFKKIGVRITVSNLPENCAGYDVVRCERTIADSKIITQGIVGATFGRSDNNKLRFASKLMTLQECYHTPNDDNIKHRGDVLMFASPEIAYQLDDVEDALKEYKNSIKLDSVALYDVNFVCHNFIFEKSNNASGTSIYYRSGLLQSMIYDAEIVNDLATKDIKFGSVCIDSPSQNTNQSVRSTKIISGLVVDATSYSTFPNYGKYLYSPRYNYSGYSNDTGMLAQETYFYPVLQSTTQNNIDVKIDDFCNIESPDPYGFADGEDVKIGNDVSTIGNFLFLNWDAYEFCKTGNLQTTLGTMHAEGITNKTLKEVLKKYSSDTTADQFENFVDITTGKKCVLLKPENGVSLISTSNILISNETGSDHVAFGVIPVTIANIYKTGVNPYGGTSETARLSDTYYSHGNYITIEDGLTSSQKIIYDGDVYGNVFIYNSGHSWFSEKYSSYTYPTVYAVPLYSRIDLLARTGLLYPDMTYRENKEYFQDIAGEYGNLQQEKDAYMYDTAYSVNISPIPYTIHLREDIDVGLYDTRIFYSDPKTNGELIDSWTTFRAANFLDVDTRYGEITGLRLFKNSLVFWLKNATGVLSVNERTMLQDVNDTNIILGNGDVLQRYDYVSTKYGMASNQLCDTLSDTTLYWWDEYNRDLIAYPGGQLVTPLKINKTVSNLINSSTILNPVLAYDNKYKEIIFSTINGKSLAYNELIQQFTSLYDVSFLNCAEVEDLLFLVNNYKIDRWNEYSKLIPVLKYVVNDKNTFTKVYDNSQIGMGESFFYEDDDVTVDNVNKLKFKFHTIDLDSECEKNITSREYDLRFAIPRNKETTGLYKYNWGERMRGRTMQCELTTTDSTEFSIQYVITKYRISWS